MHPLDFKKEDLQKLLNKQLTVEIGSAYNDDVTETFAGKLIHFGLAANPPHLPADLDFILESGVKKHVLITELKGLR